MIRKTFENKIEEFNVDGGQLIDDKGAWAYQIPMNLDYMVTNENGDMVLSQDPDKGVPTRARVRFNIGMHNTGGEGRLRTRARYLIPNNPTKESEIDYEFGAKTKNESFRDLYWNKIYTVSNFIPKYQRSNYWLTTLLTRHATAIKDVDGGLGNKTPFPYNRVNTEINPLFFIICLIMFIMTTLIWVLNFIIIPIINLVLSVIYFVINLICSIINAIWDTIDWIIDLVSW